MKFQLLCGQHEDENGTRYEAVPKVNEKGEIIGRIMPIIETNIDLVKCFGIEKFKAVDEQANLILQPEEKSLGITVADAPVPDAFGKFVGKDVTKEFPDAENLSLLVYFRGKNDYRVYDGASGQELTLCSLKRKEVQPFIKGYIES